jgi:hypothetical protein
MGMGLDRALFRAGSQLPRHAQMNEQVTMIQIDDDPFSAAAHGSNRLTAKRSGQAKSPAMAQPFAARNNALNAAPDQVRPQIAHNGFDFGEFRHDRFLAMQLLRGESIHGRLPIRLPRLQNHRRKRSLID